MATIKVDIVSAEGEIHWDTDDNQIKVGDGAATKTFSDDAVVQARANHTGTQLMSTISDAGALATLGTVDTAHGAAIASPARPKPRPIRASSAPETRTSRPDRPSSAKSRPSPMPPKAMIQLMITTVELCWCTCTPER